jgi:hypothetical protein
MEVFFRDVRQPEAQEFFLGLGVTAERVLDCDRCREAWVLTVHLLAVCVCVCVCV